jgi:hypothetical protein
MTSPEENWFGAIQDFLEKMSAVIYQAIKKLKSYFMAHSWNCEYDAI